MACSDGTARRRGLCNQLPHPIDVEIEARRVIEKAYAYEVIDPERLAAARRVIERNYHARCEQAEPVRHDPDATLKAMLDMRWTPGGLTLRESLDRSGRGTAQVCACAECGHLHYLGAKLGYDRCPIEGCDCEGQP